MGNFLITLLGGWFGLHKFLSGKKGMGVVYLLTLGLFGFGWIFDCVVAFLSMRKPAAGAAPEYHEYFPQAVPSNHLKQMQAENYERIINDCLYLIDTTADPDVFFMRYDLLIETLEKVGNFADAARYAGQIKYKTKDFIIRTYNDALIKGDALKTDRGKKNQFVRAYDKLSKYYDRMDPELISFAEEKYSNKVH